MDSPYILYNEIIKEFKEKNMELTDIYKDKLREKIALNIKIMSKLSWENYYKNKFIREIEEMM